MAEKKAGGMYLQIGLTLSQLQSDFLAAEQTVKQGIATLNRQQNLIKLRMEADTVGLDRVKDATKIIEIQERSLTQVLEMQRDKLTLATKAYQDYVQSKGANSAAAKQLETSMERERLAVARLEAQLKSLSSQKIVIDTTRLQTQLQENISKLNAKIQNVKIQADIDISRFQAANAAFDAQKVHIAAVTQELELQRQKLTQLQAQMYQSAKQNGVDSTTTLNIKSNVLQQIQEINRLETKLKELQNTNINLNVRADSIRQAEQTINENVARLNAKIEHVKVKTDIDVTRLGTMATEFDKAKAHVQGLNRELTLQNQKLAEMRKALATSISANGLNNVKTINLQTEIQKQIQAIDQLKAKINELNKIQPPKTNSLLSGYLNIKGDITGKLNQLTGAFNGISSASKSADGAITKSLEIIGAIPHPVGKAVAALASIPLVIKGIQNSLLDMAKPAIAGGDTFYVMSRGMQLSVKEMGQLSTIAKVTGIDINEVNSSLRRFSAQMNKSSNDNSLAARTLKRYGAEIYDNNGRLKNAIELSAELGKALKAAQAEGNGAAFRDIVGGRFWSADFITYLEDFADNIEQAKKVVKNGLSNPTWAHSIQGEINTLNAQTAQLGGAFSAALMPVVAEIVPQMREQFGELTKVIAVNKENIRFLGDAMALPVRMLNEFTGGVISLSTAIDELKSKDTILGSIFTRLGDYRDDVSALMSVAPGLALTTMTSPAIPTINATSLAIAAYRDEIEKFKQERAKMEEEAARKNEERQKLMENTPGLSALSEGERQKVESTLNSLYDERIKREQETADVIYKINHTSYENNLRDLRRYGEEQLRIIEETEEILTKANGSEEVTLENERKALDEEIVAKQIQLEKEKESKLAEIRQRISAADKTELEKRMIAVEDEKDAWINAGMDKAEAEELSQKQLSDYLKNTRKELNESITSLYQTELEKRLAQIEKEKQAWIDKCDDEVKATQLAEQQKVDAQRNAAMQVIKQQLEAYKAYEQGGFAGLQAYKMAELAKSGVDLRYLSMTPQQLMDFQRANQVAEKSLLPNFMTATDIAQYQQYRGTDFQRAKEYDSQNYAIVNGIKVGLSEVLGGTPIKLTLDDGSQLNVSGSQRGTITDQSGNVQSFELPGVIDEVSQSFSEIPNALQSAMDSFSELPTVVQGISENLAEMSMPNFEAITNPFANMDKDLEVTIQQFNSMSSRVEEVTVRLSDLNAALEKFSLPANSPQSQETKVPVDVNVTVQIEEAHAWDSQHIQELADKVADKIKPEIVSAVGGDSNSY